MMEILNQQAQKTKQMLAKKPPPEKNLASAINVQSWYEGVCLYEAKRIDEAIVKFKEVKKNAKMLINIGCCYLRKNEITQAAEAFQSAVQLDSHLAIGFFLLGLTNYLKTEFQVSMSCFDKALELLRGNKCVDYRQLGFNYQLYGCEILTNKAIIAIELKQYEEAKQFLLKAFECKVEKKHEKIFDYVQQFQCGEMIQPFIPPRSEVFRPAKAAIKNIKRKDYLGNSKVISTDSMDDCYACFSGIKDQVKTSKENATEPKEKKTVGRTRSELLTELAKPNRRKTLRRVQKSTDENNMLSLPEDKNQPTRGHSMPPNAPLPQCNFEDNADECDTQAEREKNNNQPTRRYSMPPNTPLPQFNFEDDDKENGKNSGRDFTDGSHEILRCRSMGSLPKPKKPLPQLNTDEKNNKIIPGTKPIEQIISTKDIDKNNKASLLSVNNLSGSQQPRKISLQDEVIEEDISEDQQQVLNAPSPNSSATFSEGVSVDVQFSFITKVRLPENYTVEDLMIAVKKQNTPKDIELFYNDEIGRQIVLTEHSLKDFNRNARKENKVLCFPTR